MQQVPQRLISKPTFLTTQVAAHARRFVTEAFGAAGARGYHYRLLAALEELGPASQADLGRRADMDRSDVVAAVNELVARGQVARAPDPSDGRRNVIDITTQGERQLRRLDRTLTQAQEKFMAPLPARDRAKYEALLKVLLAHHSRHGA